MDRPVFYAVAVIVAGFLPIYVLSGPSGQLFKPMADTMIYASDRFADPYTSSVLPVLCSWALRKGVREKRNAVLDAVKAAYGKGLNICLGHPLVDHGGFNSNPGSNIAVDPRIGAEFMPHLDEGALWIRATMPYTISFEESKKITPQIRTIIRSFPEVTVVAIGTRPPR